MPAETLMTEPVRHALIIPDGCDCGMCSPVWTRRRGKSSRFTVPVTLAEALVGEDPAAWPTMVASHCGSLAEMTSVIISECTEDDELPSLELGLPLVLFAGELAAVLQQDGPVRGELPAELVRACEQAVTTTMLAAAACLSGLLETVEAFSAIGG